MLATECLAFFKATEQLQNVFLCLVGSSFSGWPHQRQMFLHRQLRFQVRLAAQNPFELLQQRIAHDENSRTAIAQPVVVVFYLSVAC